MNISLLKCIGISNPMVFRVCCESLLDLFCFGSMSKGLSRIQAGSVQEDTIRSIIVYAEEIGTKTRGTDRSLTLSLILGAAVTSGSLQDVLRVVQLLRGGSEKLSQKAYPFVKRLNDRHPDWPLISPTEENLAGSFPLRSPGKGKPQSR